MRTVPLAAAVVVVAAVESNLALADHLNQGRLPRHPQRRVQSTMLVSIQEQQPDQ